MCCCKACARPLISDEVAMTKKLVNRGASEYLCYTCLAKHFEVTEEELKERAEYFRQTGCTLFEPHK